ncbi:hypothetical protein [Acidisoma cladoniae]|jgi:hypothetical protein|uniref:hypothetical protein n=1 Tax=Acidisoma cladoniae TaxID=3040935 RepID=UPI00254E4F37|nr:hypothetical protein [Acidisoma sp. PAMC 29798]
MSNRFDVSEIAAQGSDGRMTPPATTEESSPADRLETDVMPELGQAASKGPGNRRSLFRR